VNIIHFTIKNELSKDKLDLNEWHNLRYQPKKSKFLGETLIFLRRKILAGQSAAYPDKVTDRRGGIRKRDKDNLVVAFRIESAKKIDPDLHQNEDWGWMILISIASLVARSSFLGHT